MPARAYPWHIWFARGGITIRRGVHYHCSTSAMSQQVRNAASKRGYTVSLEEDDREGLIVRVTGSAKERKRKVVTTEGTP